MGNLLTGVVVVVFLCTAVVLLVINRTSMTETPPLSTVAFVFAVAVVFSSGFTVETTKTEAVEVTRLGSEFTVTTNSGEYVTVFAEPYAGDDYLLKRTTSVCTWGLSKTETCKLLVPTQPVVVYEKDKGE